MRAEAMAVAMEVARVEGAKEVEETRAVNSRPDEHLLFTWFLTRFARVSCPWLRTELN